MSQLNVSSAGEYVDCEASACNILQSTAYHDICGQTANDDSIPWELPARKLSTIKEECELVASDENQQQDIIKATRENSRDLLQIICDQNDDLLNNLCAVAESSNFFLEQDENFPSSSGNFMEQGGKYIEILHRIGDDNSTKYNPSRSNSDIRLWLENRSQYSFKVQRTVRPLANQLSQLGIRSSAELGRFAYVTDEILSKLGETTGEVMKSRQVFTQRVWSAWYPQDNPLTILEAWQWIIIEAIYRLDPPPPQKRHCKDFLRTELKKQKRLFKISVQKCEAVAAKAKKGKHLIKKIKYKVRNKFCSSCALKNDFGQRQAGNTNKKSPNSNQPPIPIRQRRLPQYRPVKVLPVLRPNDRIVRWGEHGLLLKKMLGNQIHFSLLKYETKVELLQMFLHEVHSLVQKSIQKLETAYRNLEFDPKSKNPENSTKKSFMKRYYDEIRSIVNDDVNYFLPTVKPMVTSQIGRLEAETKDIIAATESVMDFFKLQTNICRNLLKNLDGLLLGTYLRKEKLHAMALIKEFYLKLPAFPNDVSRICTNTENSQEENPYFQI